MFIGKHKVVLDKLIRPLSSPPGELKRAVEDVILRPDQNPLADLAKRDTIAALDLCQFQTQPELPPGVPTAATINACSCSSETVPTQQSSSRSPNQLCASTSLDTIVTHRPQPLLHRHSAGVSRRQSRVLGTLSKRKRSNSLTNYHKGTSLSVSLPPSARHTPFGEDDPYRGSLGSSESHSSIAKSEDFSQDYVAEEDESAIGYYQNGAHQANTMSTSLNGYAALQQTIKEVNAFTQYRENRDIEEMDCD